MPRLRRCRWLAFCLSLPFPWPKQKFLDTVRKWAYSANSWKIRASKLTNSMNKICPECGKPPIERGLIKCHVCGVPFVEESEMGLKLSKSQLEQISKNLVNSWRFWICFSAVFLVALLIIGVPTVTVIGVHYATKSLNASLAKFNAQASNKLTTAYQDVTNRISTALQNYEQRADAQLAAAHQDVMNQIAKEFEEPRIKEIVAQVAATQASNLLSQQVSPEIENFRTGTSRTAPFTFM